VVNAKCVEITKDGVVVDVAGSPQTIPGKTIVIAVGSKPVDHQWVIDYCTQKKIEYKVVGDAVKARRAIDAVHEGVAAAREL
jgi:hypothetical protein